MKFNKWNSKVLAPGRNNAMHHDWQVQHAGKSFAEMVLGLLINTKVAMASHLSLQLIRPTTSWVASGRAPPAGWGEGGDPCPLLCETQLEHWVRFWAESRWDKDTLQWVQQRATKVIKALQHVTCEERQRERGLFSLGRRRLKGILSGCTDTWWGGEEKGEWRQLSLARHSGAQWQHKKQQTNWKPRYYV